MNMEVEEYKNSVLAGKGNKLVSKATSAERGTFGTASYNVSFLG